MHELLGQSSVNRPLGYLWLCNEYHWSPHWEPSKSHYDVITGMQDFALVFWCAVCTTVITMILKIYDNIPPVKLIIAARVKHGCARKLEAFIKAAGVSGRGSRLAGFDASFNMGSARCKIEWNDNFEATYLKNSMDRQHGLFNTNSKKHFESACKKLVLTRKYCVAERCVNMAPRHVHTGEKTHA